LGLGLWKRVYQSASLRDPHDRIENEPIGSVRRTVEMAAAKVSKAAHRCNARTFFVNLNTQD